MKPKVTIIIPSYNTKELTISCLKSVVKYTKGISYEIIVVDNGSTDGSKELAAIKNSKNLGFAKAVNQGIKSARGEYILLLNSDTYLKDDVISKLVNFAQKTPDAGVVAPKFLNKDGTAQPSVFRFPTLKNVILQDWFGKKGLIDKYYPLDKTHSEVEAVVGAAFLITPKTLKNIGLFDERYFMYFEDLDYCRRVKHAGLKVYYLPDVEVFHLHGESGKSLADHGNQWKRLISGSKIYHGIITHYLLTFVTWSSQNAKSLFLLFLLIIPVFIKLIQPGYLFMQDDLQAFRIHQVDKCIKDFQFPCRWVPDAGYGYGYPQFIYYPPLVYYLGELFHLIGFQFIDSVKLLFILGYIFSAFGMFFLVKKIFGKWPALVSAILYTYAPYKAVEVYVRGALSEFWAFVFFPLLFFFSYRLIQQKRGMLDFVFLALSVAGLLTTHTLMTMIFFQILGCWILFWIVVEKRWRSTLKIFLSGLLGLGLASFFILPLLFERQFVHLESMLGGYFDYRAHFVSFKKLFWDFRWGYGSSGFPMEVLNLSVGLPHWIIGLFSFVVALIGWKKDKKIAALSFLLLALSLGTLFLTHQRSSFIWAALPVLHFLQFPWRFLSVAIFLLSILAGVGIYFLGKKSKVIGLVTVMAVIGLYLGFFIPRTWYRISDEDKFSGDSWQKQQTVSIFDYTPIYAKLPPPSRAPDLPEVLDGEANFAKYEKGSNWQKGDVEVGEGSATLRLPLFDFPGMEVKIDGQEVSHWNNDCRNQPYCMGLITFNVPSGEHQIEAILTNTLVRKIGDLVSGISLLVILIFLLLQFRVR